MSKSRKFFQQVRERAVRLVQEQRGGFRLRIHCKALTECLLDSPLNNLRTGRQGYWCSPCPVFCLSLRSSHHTPPS